MTASWRLELTVGALSFTIHSGDPATVPTVLSGLRVGWSTPDTDLWPGQPDPLVAVFSLLGHTAAELAPVEVGSPVSLRFYAGALDPLSYPLVETPTAVFAGKVGALTGRPIRFADPDTGDMVQGWQLDVQAVDYTAGAGEDNVSGDWPDSFMAVGQPRPAQDWVGELLTLAGHPFGADRTLYWGDGSTDRTTELVVVADAVESATLRDAVESVLAQVADPGAAEAVTGRRRGILRAKLTAQLTQDPTTPYAVTWIPKRHPETYGAPTLPAKFALLPSGKYGPMLAPRPAQIGDAHYQDTSLALSADYLSYDVSWTRTKFTEPDRVTLTSNVPKELTTAPYPSDRWRKIDVLNPGTDPAASPVTAQLETLLAWRDGATATGQLYLDDNLAADDAWTPSGFSWHASEDPSWPRAISMFPDAPTWRGYTTPVVIDGVPASQSPDGQPWHSGQLQSVDLVVERGGFRFDFTLHPRLARNARDGQSFLTGDLRTWFSGLPYTQIDRRFSHNDYRLVRRGTVDHYS